MSGNEISEEANKQYDDLCLEAKMNMNYLGSLLQSVVQQDSVVQCAAKQREIDSLSEVVKQQEARIAELEELKKQPSLAPEEIRARMKNLAYVVAMEADTASKILMELENIPADGERKFALIQAVVVNCSKIEWYKSADELQKSGFSFASQKGVRYIDIPESCKAFFEEIMKKL